MRRSEARTEAAWRSFDLWATFIVPFLIAVPAALLWMSGYGAGATGCCGAPAVASPAPTVTVPPPATVAATVTPPVAVTTPAPVAAPTSPPAATIDCASIVNGVTVAFAVNRAVLTEAGKRALDQTIGCLGTGRYEVAGHTDGDGDERSNQRLSEARARAAVRYLTSRNVPDSVLTAAGYGESRPVADNTSAEGKAKNRRITFTPK